MVLPEFVGFGEYEKLFEPAFHRLNPLTGEEQFFDKIRTSGLLEFKKNESNSYGEILDLENDEFLKIDICQFKNLYFCANGKDTIVIQDLDSYDEARLYWELKYKTLI